MKSSGSSGRWKTSTHAAEDDDWEAMFSPHYSIDSPRHKRPVLRRDGAAPTSLPLLPTTVETPSLPCIGILAQQSSDSFLPPPSLAAAAASPSSSSRSATAPHQRHDPLWADRMHVLRTIREGTTTTTSSGQQHETQSPLPLPPPQPPLLLQPPPPSSSLDRLSEHPSWFSTFWEKLKQDVKQERPASTIDTIPDLQQDDDQETTKNEKAGGSSSGKRQRRPRVPFRRSFLLFAFGFLFPPLWIVGAMYAPRQKDRTHHQQQRQSPDSQAVDLQWRRRSRNAFLIFIATVLILLILTIVLRPASVGWRVSPQLPDGIVQY